MANRSRTRSTALRRDLQGLRGIGVLFIVVGHLWRQPEGVFAMLDMFFVMSGFLITAILASALSEHGPRFLIVFYLSRFRRLVPAAALVVVVTTTLFTLVYSSARGARVGEDGLWALGFLANWHYLAVGTDYFNDHTPSPFVHYWSLSVEEQFYAVWPALVLIGIAVARRLRRLSTEAAIIGLLVVVSGGSFAYSMWHSVASPMGAYFSTVDRVWEFGIGGILGILAPRFAKLPAWAGITLGWTGCLGILASVFVVDNGVPFPAPAALLPVLLTGAILIGGIGRDTRYLAMVDNNIVVYLGDISYSLYLWHLPLSVLLLAWFPDGSTGFYLAALALSGSAAVTSFHLVEQPLRYATFLMTAPERARQLARATRSHDMNRSLRVGAMALGVTTTFVLIAAASVPNSASPVGPLLLPRATDSAPATGPVSMVERHQARILASLEQSSFPDLKPPLRGLGADHFGEDYGRYGCTDVTEAVLADCRFGRGERTAVVVGDSFAMAWMPTIRGALGDKWSVQQLTLSECSAWTLPSYLHGDGSPNPECAAHHDLVQKVVPEMHPDLLIVASSWFNVRNIQRADIEGTAEQVAREGLGQTLDQLGSHADRVVVLGSPPTLGALLECRTRAGGPGDCVTSPSQEWRDDVAGESSAAASHRAEFVQTKEWFCYETACPAFVGSTPMTYDGQHLTIDYALLLAPLLREALAMG